MAKRRSPFTPGDANGLQPHRDGRAGRALFQQGRLPLARAARPEQDFACRLQGAGEGGNRRNRHVRQGLREQVEGHHRSRGPAGDAKATATGHEEGRAAARDRRQCRQARRCGPGSAERHLRRDVVRRLGRQERDAHHGFARVHFAAVVRAGGRPRSPQGLLRHG